jgi:hypothetical protein
MNNNTYLERFDRVEILNGNRIALAAPRCGLGDSLKTSIRGEELSILTGPDDCLEPDSEPDFKTSH